MQIITDVEIAALKKYFEKESKESLYKKIYLQSGVHCWYIENAFSRKKIIAEGVLVTGCLYLNQSSSQKVHPFLVVKVSIIPDWDFTW